MRINKNAISTIKIVTAAIVSAMVSISAAYAKDLTSVPGKRIKDTVGEVRSIVQAEKGKIADRDLDAKLRAVIMPVFNFADMSRLCLGPNWGKGTPEQQAEFVSLFSDMLADTYLSKIKKIDRTSTEFVSENVRDDRAEIKTSLEDDGDVFPIDYRLRFENGSWRVFDVLIENISLVSNYRNEFSGIVRREGFNGLVTRLREKRVETKPIK